MRSIVKELFSRDGRRKVQIFRRADGLFGFQALYFSENPAESCWGPYAKFSNCIAPSEELAEREARGRVAWLRDESDAG